MTSDQIWNSEETVSSLLDLTVPPWIDQEITASTVAAICQGGCESGAYMPAVTYHTARETMNQHGDDILDELVELSDGMPAIPRDTSWSGIAVFFLSMAVEIWSDHVMEMLTELETEDRESKE